ncbi:betaine--homocysteine S-methyltransferase [Faunimonas sp. B44]|uniref:betaine--homocysteine S-methyltransferase n=1 Tax=Faunimonas sp. B44 TaxID=3461493 RepID=UPI004044B762
MASLERLLAEGRILLADGATGTNLFDMGLTAGDPPEFWNTEHPDRVKGLHAGFLQAGADIILTNSFGSNRHRLKLHNAQSRVFELNKRAAELAREAAEEAGRDVIVAGSMGPTGELFQPLGELTEADAIESFAEQAEGLKAGGADVAWIETMSATEEMLAAARGAIAAGLPYVVTASFDTAGRTMMGLQPADMPAIFAGLPVPPLAVGANCGVGASDLLVSVLSMGEGGSAIPIVAKANCGVPQFHGEHIHYSGTPELMAEYVRLAANAGARIIGGCCGTTATHLLAMREALDRYQAGPRPTQEDIEAVTGLLASPPKKDAVPRRRGRRG